LVGYLALGMMAAGFSIAVLQFLWFFTVDGPHVLSTITRTYFDRQERGRLGWMLWIVVPSILVGPVLSWAGYGGLFLLFAVCWQHLHIVKQHFGFVMLYKAKNRDRDRLDFHLDRWFLLSSLVAPLAIFVLRTQPKVQAVMPEWSAQVIAAFFGAFAIVWVVRQIQKLSKGLVLNIPKIALIVAVVPLQWWALLEASKYGPGGIVRAGIALGLFHGLQYHRLIRFHNRNRYLQPGAEERHGSYAVTLAGSLFQHLALAIGLNIVLVFLPPVFVPGEAMQCAVWGLAFTHYLLDARIWRVRGDRELAAALRLG
jgi:hypothetical protein